MAITEERRHGLYSGLEAVIGTEHTATLMELLPPVGWADVATKRDLDHFADRLRAEWSRQMIGFVISIVAANAATTALIVAVAKLAG